MSATRPKYSILKKFLKLSLQLKLMFVQVNRHTKWKKEIFYHKHCSFYKFDFPINMFWMQEKVKLVRSSSSFRSLVLFLLEYFLLPHVEIKFSPKYGLLKCENCRASRSFVLYTPQKNIWHFFMSFLLDSLCFITMCFPGTELLTSYSEMS